jgi:glycine/D-amino acid oxidase-like deaminating enzyme
LPAYYVENGAGAFYGFPSLDGATMKVAEHTGGEPVADPSRVDRAQRAADVVRVAEFVKDHLPAVETTPARHSVCLYTMTPDRHFLIDRHPRWGNVAFAAGFSGHGFKFAPVVGEALADLATGQTTRLPIGFLSPRRWGGAIPHESGPVR